MLNFLYAEWSHPLFISIQRYAEIMQGTGLLDNIKTDNWVKQTIASWWHSIWVGVFNPWPVIKR
jgi:MPBQ/MSBQ methyltransferase